jgi:ABC-type sugar transport system ATPase subunit
MSAPARAFACRAGRYGQMPQVSVQTSLAAETRGVTKRYSGTLALDKVDFSVSAGEVRALLGRNGAGKSTLIRMLAGVEKPDEGAVLIAGTPLHASGAAEATARGVATVYQELSLVGSMSVADNFFMGSWPHRHGLVDDQSMRHEAQAALYDLGVDVDPFALVESLGIADQQMVEIARAFRSDCRLLILDEPSSALAEREVSVLLERVRRIATRGVAVIYVTHRIDEVRQVADSLTILRDGKHVETSPVARRSTEDVVHLMLGDIVMPSVARRDRATSSAASLLVARGLAIPPRIKEVSFELWGGEVLGIAGVLGAGRAELLRCIAGADHLARGEILLEGQHVEGRSVGAMLRLGVGLASEDRKRDSVIAKLGVDENIVLSDWKAVSRWGMLSKNKKRDSAVRLTTELSIKVPYLSAPLRTLSGGNQQKAVLARLLHARARVLLLNEPTRGVDVGAKAQLYGFISDLASKGIAVIVVSSEFEELVLVCDRVMILRAGRICGEVTGDELTLQNLLLMSLMEQNGREP